ncbi:MAG TPA: tetratricopeptide repeat protein [Lentimicrobium sp.]|nr:tetratricopeptide repeat protein [Lentimicrobium sp.]
MKRTVAISILALTVFLQTNTQGQQTENQDPRYASHDLYLKEHYGPARFAYSKLVEAKDLLVEYDDDKDYYYSTSAATMQHGDAAYLLEDFLKKHPESTRSNRVWVQLGHLYFRNNSYKNALEAYSNVSTSDMNQEERAEFIFKRGYSYFKGNDLERAAQAFSQIKDKQTKYTGPANYYYAHIMYADGKYETALRDFQKLKNDETFKNVVPYYIIQIYYVQGKYDEMLQMAEPYLKGTRNKRTNEMLRLVADVHYRKGNYKEAIKLMEDYAKVNSNKMTREDHYMLAFAYYMTGEYTKAIPEFQTVASGNDTLAQNAFYHLGDSYIKTNQKKFASNAFSSAWKIPIMNDIAEESLFNYAKLSVELSDNPYNEAIKALQQYINQYPDSRRKDEAYTYLANLYLVTKNYEEALASLDLIKNKNATQKSIYQKITYFRGLELFNEEKYYEAIGLFKKSLENKVDPSISKGALLWQGEAYYRLGQYEVASNYYRDFLQAGQGHPAYDAANYNLAYCWFKMKNYPQAQKSFNSFLNSKPKDQRLLNDAKLRLADCYFMMRQYRDAATYYDQVGNARAADADYALYQSSIVKGVLSSNDQKISSLQKLITDYPKSPFSDDARFELGRTYLAQKRNNEALSAFQRVITDYPKSSLVKDALLNTGLIYYNTNRDQQALETLKKVVNDYPSTPASREALAVIRNIYVDMNKVDDYVEYTEDIPFANVTRSEQDSLTFAAVENRYMSGDCEKSLPGLKSYVEKFPDGSFILNAHYYKADCETRAGNVTEALKSYEAILERPRNNYSENAALKASGILYQMKDYNKALEMYQKLEESAESKANISEALIGQMRCNAEVGNSAQAIMYAQRVLTLEQIPQNIQAEANLIIGRSSIALRRPEEARAAFAQTVKLSQGEAGAEALYNLSQIAFEMKDYSTAENNVFKLSSDYPSYQYWMAKGFLILADIYVIQDNNFQAKQTLQSIIDNYEGEDIKQQAINKLKEIENSEIQKPSGGRENEADESIIIK